MGYERKTRFKNDLKVFSFTIGRMELLLAEMRMTLE